MPAACVRACCGPYTCDRPRFLERNGADRVYPGVDRDLGGKPTTRLGRGLPRAHQHSAQSVKPDDTPDRARLHRGMRLRVVLSNEYGSAPLVIDAAHVALADTGTASKAGSDRALTFSGNTSATIPPGASVLSDPVTLPFPRSAP